MAIWGRGFFGLIQKQDIEASRGSETNIISILLLKILNDKKGIWSNLERRVKPLVGSSSAPSSILTTSEPFSPKELRCGFYTGGNDPTADRNQPFSSSVIFLAGVEFCY